MPASRVPERCYSINHGARHLELQTAVRYRESCLSKQSLRGKVRKHREPSANSTQRQTLGLLVGGFVV